MPLWRIGLVSVALLGACHRERMPGLSNDVPSSSTAAEIASGPQGTLPLDTPTGRLGAHPRILLTPERMSGLEAMSRAGHPSWTVLQRNCDEANQKPISSGYMGEDWANAALDLALCGRVLKKDASTKNAIKYLLALVDDATEVGDGKGGDTAARQDDGYAIRNRGFLAAIAYDWLHDDMSADQRKHVVSRFYAYVTWYKKDGYRKDEPWSNHFMGYFGAAAMGGLAADGDDPKGAEMHKLAREIWNKVIVPGYRTRLAGGDYPEGWQYARLIGGVLGLWVDAEGRATPAGTQKLIEELPWLRESVAFQTHAHEPDGKHVFDSADWSKKPAEPFNQQLYGVAIALGANDPASRRALYLARNAKRIGEPGWNWLRVVGDDPSRAAEDPRTGPTSYFAKGTGVVFARTAWSPSAVWVAFNSGPFFGDHQHLDQGHFEIVREDDALLIDPGDYDAYSTMSHNAILVDDKKENDRWSPNQAIYSKTARIERFSDEGGTVWASAEYTDAYNPDEYPRYKKTRTVSRAERELLFSRTPIATMPGSGVARVVVYDRISLTKPTYGVTWAGHASVRPEQSGSVLKIAVGRSAATLSTLLPAGATASFLKEPTAKGDEPFTNNNPAEGIASTRFEIASARGKTERRFLTAIVVGSAADRAPPATRIEGDGIDGAAIADEAYLFPSAALQRMPAAVAYRAPTTATRHVITGLAPKGKYAASVSPDAGLCRVALVPGGNLSASAAGALVLSLAPACALK
jgi:Heparinase II/III-like protein